MANFTERCPEVGDLDNAMSDAIHAIASRLSAVERSSVCWLVKEAARECTKDECASIEATVRSKREVAGSGDSAAQICELLGTSPGFWLLLLAGLLAAVACAAVLGFVHGRQRGMAAKMLLNLSLVVFLFNIV
ncbi:hypothetical protein M3Y99_01279900 [Aphelenchoides fujianensis]|nr:hypothetical protein M3Y99_01279900 [Aphelenchoides fujianensis]